MAVTHFSGQDADAFAKRINRVISLGLDVDPDAKVLNFDQPDEVGQSLWFVQVLEEESEDDSKEVLSSRSRLQCPHVPTSICCRM